MTTENDNAKACLATIGRQIADIDAELAHLVDLLVADKIIPTLARVREINLRRRRDTLQGLYNSVNASIKHF